jgi:hemerythrin-like domain-containing protein
MAKATTLLNDDGTASMATAMMMSHHGFRRDLTRFARALAELDGSDGARASALQGEWRAYHEALHHHHEAEDTRMFPHFASQIPALAPVIEGLTVEHRRLDPLLERGDAAFARLPDVPHVAEARAVIAELGELLAPHLELEEAQIIPYLRNTKDFPPPANDEEATLFADGFAWSAHGVAREVLDKVDAMLPAALRARMPAAREAFAARHERVWGKTAPASTYTSLPDL